MNNAYYQPFLAASENGWHWLRVKDSPPFPALWNNYYWKINGFYCSIYEAFRRGYEYVDKCPYPDNIANLL